MSRREQLPLTVKALDVYLPDICAIRGGRQSVHDQPGLNNGPVGFQEADFSIHNPEDVDDMAMESDLTGTDHVRIVDRELPMFINQAIDETPRYGADQLSDAKKMAVTSIATLLGKTLHYEEDDSFVFSIQQASDRTSQNRKITDEVLVVGDRDGVATQIDKVVDMNGLPIVIGDFHGVAFPDKADLGGVLAVKVNHLLEREIPANVGFISLGGAVELDTGNERDLRNFNELLQETHDQTIDRLEDLGAHVVSVVVDPRLESGFDVPQVDADIASALQAMSR